MSSLTPSTVVFPVGQALQLFCPDKAWYFPASHWAHVAVRSAIEKVPGTHNLHGSTPPKPYDPALQDVHGPSDGPDEPGEQKHSDLSVAPGRVVDPAGHGVQKVAPDTLAYAPAGQAVQDCVPLLSLNFPASHMTHVPSGRTSNPASQMQWPGDGLPTSRVDESRAHGVQVDDELAPRFVEKVAMSHCVHDQDAGAVE
jgi:hypothetical protein